jgi:hypothetical protein
MKPQSPWPENTHNCLAAIAGRDDDVGAIDDFVRHGLLTLTHLKDKLAAEVAPFADAMRFGGLRQRK